MSSLDAAQRRLEDALKRVEAAMGRRPKPVAVAGGQFDGSALEHALAQMGAERDALSENVNQLRDECGRLNEALDAAHRDNVALRRVNEEVARRLDGTIDELQQLLDA
jgi:predicted  nucleic acid-binding Zn-ribbon protein